MIIEFSVVPMGQGAHLSKSVARIAEIIDTCGLEYQITAMGTIVEGDWDSLMALVRRCHDELKSDHERVYTTIRIDDKGDRKGLLKGKVQAVEQHIGRKLKT